MKKLFLLLFLLLTLISCKKETSTNQEDIQNLIIEKDSVKEIEITIRDTVTIKVPKKLFILIQKEYEGKNFTILNVALGNIDFNNTEDAVIIIQTTTNKKVSESLLVYQNNNDSYNLIAQNRSIITEEYFFTDEHTNSSKEIKIIDHHLKIALFCYGPCGNTFLDFKFDNNDLLLKTFSTYDAGAGAQIERNFDVEKSMVTITTTNTMTEDMPITEEQFTFEYSKGIRFLDLNTKSLFSDLSELESKTIF
ncbi:hypothetical protein FIA58_020870 [Flavobacterium jejuense]|uniref:Auto-transporter adhesin head GIN domain-containing protein n=1 Tax=Flavobacterium jejuense TaxID=1544455 RepID=A0ABX0J027_9FLAO|nr:hypothetical protein [Flavobacterium jejuense]NHN28138.1 hypothetical protein [Flavobacterium jejuense]